MDKEFRYLLEQYKQKAGLTFTIFLLDEESHEKAKQQMRDYLSGKRKDIVTDKSIGMKAEEVIIN